MIVNNDFIDILGFGNEIDWVRWTDAEKMAKDQNKPIFLLIHKTWCRACQGMYHHQSSTLHMCLALKNAFVDNNSASYKQFVDESKHFIMVNAEDNEEPEGDQYHPDGFYFPRTLFYGMSVLVYCLISHLYKYR